MFKSCHVFGYPSLFSESGYVESCVESFLSFFFFQEMKDLKPRAFCLLETPLNRSCQKPLAMVFLL